MTPGLHYHPLANLFPLMAAAELAELPAAIARDGQRRPIVADDDGVLDGRNRYQACLALGLTPRLRAYDPRPHPAGDGPDRLAFVLAENLERRHLNDDQRRMVAARLANMGRGRPADNPAQCGIKLPDAAKLLHVDAAGTERARTVLARAGPEIRAAVDGGKLTVTAAAQASKLAPALQLQIAADAQAGRSNVVRGAIKKAARAVREAALGGSIAALPEERFGLIAADPEWRFSPFSCETGMDRAADNHYRTGDDASIAARRPMIDRIAAPDCVLAMWVTDLARGIDTLRAWGFEFKSYFVWLKNLSEIELTEAQKKTGLCGRVFMHMGAPGTGYWNIDEDELLLIGARGHPVCPAPGQQGGSVWYELKRAHSQKPESFYGWVERHFAHIPRVELNARPPRRPGWQVWGDDVTPAPPAMVAREREAMARSPAPSHDAPAAIVPSPSPSPACEGGSGRKLPTRVVEA